MAKLKDSTTVSVKVDVKLRDIIKSLSSESLIRELENRNVVNHKRDIKTKYDDSVDEFEGMQLLYKIANGHSTDSYSDIQKLKAVYDQLNTDSFYVGN